MTQNCIFDLRDIIFNSISEDCLFRQIFPAGWGGGWVSTVGAESKSSE